VPGKKVNDRLTSRRAAQPPQGFEDGQVGFARAIMLDALPAADPQLAISGTLLQKSLNERGLTNPRLAGDKDDLAFAPQGFL